MPYPVDYSVFRILIVVIAKVRPFKINLVIRMTVVMVYIYGLVNYISYWLTTRGFVKTYTNAQNVLT